MGAATRLTSNSALIGAAATRGGARPAGRRPVRAAAPSAGERTFTARPRPDQSRRAPLKADRETVWYFTTSPDSGALIILPPPA